MLILGLILLVVVGWHGVVFVRSYGYLKGDSVILAQGASNLSMYMLENGWVKEFSSLEFFRGMLVNKGNCLQLWDGNLMRCFEWSGQTLGLIYMGDGEGWVERRSINALVEGGWIRKREVVTTNEERVEVYVSDPEKVGIREVMRILKFGDIVMVVTDLEMQEVVGVIMVHQGRLI